jgi:hypothetical protein
MKKVEFDEKELELIMRALKEAQLYSIDKAEEYGRPQSANDYITKLNRIRVKLQQA